MKDTKDLLDFEIYPHLDRAESGKRPKPSGQGGILPLYRGRKF